MLFLYTDLLQALKGERLSSVFSSDGAVISASTAPHYGGPAAGKHDADREKQPRLSVLTTLEHAGWPILATG